MFEAKARCQSETKPLPQSRLTLDRASYLYPYLITYSFSVNDSRKARVWYVLDMLVRYRKFRGVRDGYAVAEIRHKWVGNCFIPKQAILYFQRWVQQWNKLYQYFHFFFQRWKWIISFSSLSNLLIPIEKFPSVKDQLWISSTLY